MVMKRFTATLESTGKGATCFVLIPFDVRAEFGRARPPIRGTINRAPYRSTVAVYGGKSYLGIRRELREAAGVTVGERAAITMQLDDAPRVVDPPPALAVALRRDKAARAAWDKLSFTHQKEWADAIQEAKRDETRERRVAQALSALRGK